MALETRVICDICGQVIREGDDKSRRFKAKEYKSYRRRVCDEYLLCCDGWQDIDCHSECIEKLLKAKAETEAKRSVRSSD